MYACVTWETFVFTVFRRVFHSILKLELCRHACRRRDQIIPACRYGKNMPTTALVLWHYCASRSCRVLSLYSQQYSDLQQPQRYCVIRNPCSRSRGICMCCLSLCTVGNSESKWLQSRCIMGYVHMVYWGYSGSLPTTNVKSCLHFSVIRVQ